MPPKSSNKKSQAIWFNCDQCKTIITSKDRDSHDKICSTDTTAYTALDYIKDNCLYTTNIHKKHFAMGGLDEISPKYLNNLIFVSESMLRLCEFRVGQALLIRSTLKPELPPLVRNLWPITDQFQSTIFVTSQDFDENWPGYQGAQVSIMKIPPEVKAIPAKLVRLRCVAVSPLQESSFSDVEMLLHEQMKNLTYVVGNKVTLKFYNKFLQFEVTSFTSMMEDNSLESEFEKLGLTENLFVVVHSTILEFEKTSDPEKVDGQEPRVEISDIGGLGEQIKLVQESMNIALGHQKTLPGVKVSRGLLLFGPTGCGKTMICEAMSAASKALTIRINASELFSKFLGETEKNLSQQFDQAYRNYPKPSLIIIEDVHNLCPKNETNDVVKRVSVAFLSMLDSLATRKEASALFVIATTGNIDNLNSGIRRCGRLDCEVEIPAPSPKGRLEILLCHLSKVRHNLNDEFVKQMAHVTHGFVGSDLANLIYTAGLTTIRTGRLDLGPDDISYALNRVKPSAMREVLIENPNVKWTDIGGQDDLKLKLKQAIEWPLQHPEKFTRLGIKPPRGILMFGPPGCSKTMIAKALATESQVNFLSIKGPELFSMWVGESERAVREVFRKARQVAPSIVFFDEIDAIGGERSTDGGGTSVKERVLTQLLTELDGVNTLKDVTIVAATNRPDMIDKALLRPGRIDRIVYVGLPDVKSRREIFRIKLQAMPLASDVDVEQLVQRTEGYSGAEIQAVCHEAALKVLEESFESEFVTWKEFEYALNAVQPRTTPELLKLYDEYIKRR